MGAFLDKPKTEKYNESKNGGGLRYGLSSMQVSSVGQWAKILKEIVAWSAFNKFDCKQKLQEYHLTYIIFYYNK